MSAERLIRVEAPHFVAGLVLVDRRCTEAAPILGWAVGQTDEDLNAYFSRKGWRAKEAKAS